MKNLKEILEDAKQKNPTAKEITRKMIGNVAYDWMVEGGYIRTEVYGWEKPEYLEKFGLDPNATGVPCQLYDEMDFKERKVSVKDEFGHNTGEFRIERMPVKTGRKIWGAIPAYLEYRKFKKRLFAEWYQKTFNEPPPDAETIPYTPPQELQYKKSEKWWDKS